MINLMNTAKYICGDVSEIENYDKAIADMTQIWDCHHRQETHNPDGTRRSVDLRRSDLIAWDLYYKRPVNELIFLRHDEHMRLHHDNLKDKEHKPNSKNIKVFAAVYNVYKAVGGTMSWKAWRKQRKI